MQREPFGYSERAAPYWEGGVDGILRIARCQECQFYIHPPMPVCPRCRSRAVEFEPVSGRGTVHSFTISRYEWTAGIEPPYLVAQVELVEQEGLIVLTNIVDCDVDAAAIGMQVSVRFIEAGNAWIPVFRP